jgi:curved DNA-binding protein CbpA
MAKFEEIDEARKLLGLRESATLKEIKQAYRRMAFRYHPDRGGGKESVARTYPYDEYLERYYYGWFKGI